MTTNNKNLTVKEGDVPDYLKCDTEDSALGFDGHKNRLWGFC